MPSLITGQMNGTVKIDKLKARISMYQNVRNSDNGRGIKVER